jgi:hypothetical protein
MVLLCEPTEAVLWSFYVSLLKQCYGPMTFYFVLRPFLCHVWDISSGINRPFGAYLFVV